MSLARTYFETVQDQLRAILETQLPAIERAAAECCRCLLGGTWIYVFGTGHSHMLAEELFYRAGGLARIRPILHPPLMLHVSAHASTDVERDVGVVATLLHDYPVSSGDVLIVASNSGRNPVPVELAMQARDRGAYVVALVNRRHCTAFPSRHPSGGKLPDVASLVIDNCGVVGDACVPVAGTELKIGAASTVTGATILQMVSCLAIEKALEQGWTVEVFRSANAGQEADNDALVAKLRQEVKHF